MIYFIVLQLENKITSIPMKFNPWTFIIVFVLIIVIYFSLPESGKMVTVPDADSSAVMRVRVEKNNAFSTGEDSPILDKKSFKNLAYYPYSKDWRIKFKLTRNEKPALVSIQMSNGTQEEMIQFGTISAEIQGKMVSLTLFQHTSGDFFLPFKDKTAPKETYGGGRYLDFSLKNLNNNLILIDFNLAYFPYCAYNEAFACPVPPQENSIDLRVPAGEKTN